MGALLAYGVVGVTDYQLDNVAISGVIIIYLACLLQLWQLETPPPRPHPAARPCFLAGLTLLLIMGLWLWPWLRAWQLSEISFRALTAEKIPAFTRFLNQARRTAPWEPYYPLQLGWNLGELSLTAPEPAQRAALSQEAMTAFQGANAIAPNQEFGFNNLGWLQLAENPQQASQSFIKALRLVPAKRGLFYGLGLSLLAQQQPTLAIEAFSLECLRDPLFLTNPIWRTPRFASPLSCGDRPDTPILRSRL